MMRRPTKKGPAPNCGAKDFMAVSNPRKEGRAGRFVSVADLSARANKVATKKVSRGEGRGPVALRKERGW